MTSRATANLEDALLTTATTRFSDQSGMTLLEMMIVITLLGIVATIVIPSGLRSSRSFEVVEEARKVHSEIAMMRARAVAEATPFRFALGSNEISFSREESGTFKTYRSIAFPDEMTVRFNGGTSGSTTFNRLGRVDSPAVITFSDGGREHTVRILASGLSRWEGRTL